MYGTGRYCIRLSRYVSRSYICYFLVLRVRSSLILLMKHFCLSAGASADPDIREGKWETEIGGGGM
jgi:hypothetical protein